MRRAKKTWKEIADYLDDEARGDLRVKADFTTICNFARRVSQRAKKGTPPPIWFEPDSQPADPRTEPKSEMKHTAKKEEPHKPTDPFSTEVPIDNSDPFADFKKQHNL
jgi:hypothetical protein